MNKNKLIFLCTLFLGVVSQVNIGAASARKPARVPVQQTAQGTHAYDASHKPQRPAARVSVQQTAQGTHAYYSAPGTNPAPAPAEPIPAARVSVKQTAQGTHAYHNAHATNPAPAQAQPNPAEPSTNIDAQDEDVQAIDMDIDEEDEDVQDMDMDIDEEDEDVEQE